MRWLGRLILCLSFSTRGAIMANRAITKKISALPTYALNNNNGNLLYSEGGTNYQFPLSNIALLSNLGSKDGLKYIGRCLDVSDLRTLNPNDDGQEIWMDKYDRLQPHTLGGGKLRYNASINDSNVISKNIDVLIFRTTSGKYFERVDVDYVTPYMAGAWGDWDPATKTGHGDETEIIQKAIRAAEAVPIFFAGTTIVGDFGRYRGWAQGAKNCFKISGRIEVQQLLVSTDNLGAVWDGRDAPYGTAADPRKFLVFVNKINASNHAISTHYLPRMMGKFDSVNHSYHLLLSFENQKEKETDTDVVTTGTRIHLFGGILEGGWRGIQTFKDHFYYAKFDTISVDHCSHCAFYGYVEGDSGEEIILDNCKFFQSENCIFLGNAVWSLRNVSAVFSYGGDLIKTTSGYINMDTCHLEGYRDMVGYMINQPGGSYPSIVNHVNTKFVKISRSGEQTMLANPQPFYVGPGAAHYGDKAQFDKVFKNDNATDTVRLATALHAGAGGKCVFKNSHVPTTAVGENNYKYSFPPALVPSGNVTKNGAIDNAWMTSTNTSIAQCGSFIGLGVFGQSGVVGAPSTYGATKRGWTENGVEVASVIHNNTGLVFNVSTSASASQTYSAIVGVLPSSDLDAYLPQVTYSSDADFNLVLYYVKTTKQFTNDANVELTGVRVLSQPVVVNLPAQPSSVDTLPNMAPFQEGVQFGGLKGSAQASHVLMCINSKTSGSTFTMKNASFVTI